MFSLVFASFLEDLEPAPMYNSVTFLAPSTLSTQKNNSKNITLALMIFFLFLLLWYNKARPLLLRQDGFFFLQSEAKR